MADDLVVAEAIAVQDNPAAVYLASLTSAASRRTMHTALNTIAGIVSRGEHTAETLPWGSLRYSHTQAIRSVLVERYKPATANKILSALRGVLEKAYKLGYLSPEEFSKASDIKGVRGTSEADPAGRELSFA